MSSGKEVREKTRPPQKPKVIVIKPRRTDVPYKTQIIDMANQLAKLLYKQVNYKLCLGHAQQVHKKNLDGATLKLIYPAPPKDPKKPKCQTKTKNGRKCGCSVCTGWSWQKGTQDANEIARVRRDIHSIVQHAQSHKVNFLPYEEL